MSRLEYKNRTGFIWAKYIIESTYDSKTPLIEG